MTVRPKPADKAQKPRQTSRKKKSAALDPRKLPTQSRAVSTMEAVLDAAEQILERDGYGAYTTNAVAQLAGASIGSLYQYFPNKDAITKALIVRHSGRLLDEMSKLDLSRGGEAALRQMISIAIAQQLRRPVLARFLDMEERRLPLDQELRRIGGELAASLDRCLRAPDIAAFAAPDTAAADLIAMTRGIVDMAGEQGATDVDGLFERVERAVFGYLSYQPPRRKRR